MIKTFKFKKNYPQTNNIPKKCFKKQYKKKTETLRYFFGPTFYIIVIQIPRLYVYYVL